MSTLTWAALTELLVELWPKYMSAKELARMGGFEADKTEILLDLMIQAGEVEVDDTVPAGYRNCLGEPEELLNEAFTHLRTLFAVANARQRMTPAVVAARDFAVQCKVLTEEEAQFFTPGSGVKESILADRVEVGVSPAKALTEKRANKTVLERGKGGKKQAPVMQTVLVAMRELEKSGIECSNVAVTEYMDNPELPLERIQKSLSNLHQRTYVERCNDTVPAAYKITKRGKDYLKKQGV